MRRTCTRRMIEWRVTCVILNAICTDIFTKVRQTQGMSMRSTGVTQDITCHYRSKHYQEEERKRTETWHSMLSPTSYPLLLPRSLPQYVEQCLHYHPVYSDHIFYLQLVPQVKECHLDDRQYEVECDQIY